jgi:hypothetical protein
VSGKQVASIEQKLHRFDEKEEGTEPETRKPVSPKSQLRRGNMQLNGVANNSTSPTTPSMSGAGTPPPPLTADAQSLRSDSIPSTTQSAVDEPVTGMIAIVGKPADLLPQIDVTDTDGQVLQ